MFNVDGRVIGINTGGYLDRGDGSRPLTGYNFGMRIDLPELARDWSLILGAVGGVLLIKIPLELRGHKSGNRALGHVESG